MSIIQIDIDTVSLRLKCLETPTARAIQECLPFESEARTWGQEVYFSAPVSSALEANARDVVEAGEIAFWVEGQCIAIGFGKTPISGDGEIRLAARTNIWAEAIDDVSVLKTVKDGAKVTVSRIES